MRESTFDRKTGETDVSVGIVLEGSGEYDVETGCGFLNHMLQLFAVHGRFDLKVKCVGDTEVDYHHTVEDVGLVLGRALSDALANRAGIKRYGHVFIPMDEALVLCAVDISGRAALGYALDVPSQKIGDFDTELVKEFFTALTRTLGAGVHLRSFCGENSHHIVEAAFKAFGRALAQAVAIDPTAAGRIPSSKGSLV